MQPVTTGRLGIPCTLYLDSQCKATQWMDGMDLATLEHGCDVTCRGCGVPRDIEAWLKVWVEK